LVVKKLLRSKSAFTMIELIFAIVIISIAVISLPVMTKITEKGIESNILQEAIFAASTELMSASTGYWDANSMNDINNSIARVIDTDNLCSVDRLRLGHIAQPLHRRCLDDNSSVVDADEVASNSSLETFEHSGASDDVFDYPGGQASGYKDAYTSTLAVDRNVSVDKDIKFINVLVKDSDGNDVTRLRMQSANIGEIDYYKRRF